MGHLKRLQVFSGNTNLIDPESEIIKKRLILIKQQLEVMFHRKVKIINQFKEEDSEVG